MLAMTKLGWIKDIPSNMKNDCLVLSECLRLAITIGKNISYLLIIFSRQKTMGNKRRECRFLYGDSKPDTQRQRPWCSPAPANCVCCPKDGTGSHGACRWAPFNCRPQGTSLHPCWVKGCHCWTREPAWAGGSRLRNPDGGRLWSSFTSRIRKSLFGQNHKNF